MKKTPADLEKICCRCEKATWLKNEAQVLCEKKGVVSANYCCRAFRYDPLKRSPKQVSISSLTNESAEELP